MSNLITISATVHAPIEKIWEYWNSPEHITQWNNASPDWHTPYATIDLQAGGKFTSRMEAKDGSFGFDFEGVYDEVETNKLIRYTIADGRKVTVVFELTSGAVLITERFEAENQHSIEMQQAGWQAILNNFKKYVES
jgi:uncharacterized protein YndB with AHSA1/START domain